VNDFENDFEQEFLIRHQFEQEEQAREKFASKTNKEEFLIRHQFEQEEQAREKFASKTNKELGDIRALARRLEEKLDGLAARPMPTVPAPVVQHIHHEKPSPKEWTLEVTSRENGLMRTVVASADGEKSTEFTIYRTPDGYPKKIKGVRA